MFCYLAASDRQVALRQYEACVRELAVEPLPETVALYRWISQAPVAQALAKTLGVRLVPDEPLETTLPEFVRPRTLLVVLDNCEHLVSACARLVSGLCE